MFKLPFGRTKLMLMEKTQDHPQKMLKSTPGDLGASERYSCLDPPDGKSPKSDGNIHNPSHITELADFNIDTNRNKNGNSTPLRLMIKSEGCKVLKVEAMHYDSLSSTSKVTCRVKVNCNGEMKIGDLNHEEVKKLQGGWEALKRFRPMVDIGSHRV
jgi:hypothetical protein